MSTTEELMLPPAPPQPDTWGERGNPDPLTNRKGLVGAPVSRLDGPSKVTGTARYAAEVPMTDIVYAALAYSTIAKGRIATLDTRAAKPPPKTADAHYGTPEHRAWREEVIRRADGHCQWPGCNRTGCRLFADHIVEKQDGGALLDVTNGQTLCAQHHSIKTAQARAARHTRGAD